ncbi:MAG: hypothetical protein IID40_05535 [Planctomycetes bacterium]|nr:hypothetical protein [Planctomycetota bacterium]
MSKPNKRPAYQSPVPYREGLRWSCLVIVVLAVSVDLAGCDEPEDPEADRVRRFTEELSRELRTERLRRDRDQSRHEAELVVAQGDREAAVLGWISTAAAVFLLVLLLVRERRTRQVLERLLRAILDRIREPPRSPPSPTPRE